MDFTGSRGKRIFKKPEQVPGFTVHHYQVSVPGCSTGAGGSGRAGGAPRWAQPVLDTHPGHPEPQPGWQGRGGCLGQRVKLSRERERERRNPQSIPGAEPHGREQLLRECQVSFNSSLQKHTVYHFVHYSIILSSTWASSMLYSPSLHKS